jgi:Rrf2 family nitric oxide-sensitive transcriptional repressor
MLIKIMQLDKFSDYALRILVTLAVYNDRKVPTSEIARKFRLSDHHLSKVASRLVHAGFVTSERGRSGGLLLARDAKDITIGQVLRALKADEPVVECFGNNSDCLIMPACGLRSPLAAAKEAFFGVLDEYSLAAVTTDRSTLSMLLADIPKSEPAPI